MTIADKLTSISTTKQSIKEAIEAKSVTVGSIPFSQYANKISEITGSGGDPLPPDWVRPSDWLPMPNVAPTEQKFVGLFAVFNESTNYLAFSATGAYTVDWGDGVVENFATGVVAYHVYDFASISDSTLSSRGYKQVIVVVTPQNGQNITSIDLTKKHSSFISASYNYPWLDLSLGSPNLTGFIISQASTTCYFCNIERIKVVSWNPAFQIKQRFSNLSTVCYISLPATRLNNQSFDSVFTGCNSLVYVDGLDFYSATNAVNVFQNCYSLSKVPIIDLYSCTGGISYIFDGCYSIKELNFLNTSSVVYANYAFQNCRSLQKITGLQLNSCTGGLFYVFGNCSSLYSIPQTTIPLATMLYYTFNGCSKLRSVSFDSIANVSSINSAFVGCSSLEKITLGPNNKITDATMAFSSCFSLKEIPSLDFASNTSSGFNGAFSGCYSLSSFKATNLKLNFSVSNSRLSAVALNDMFNNLPTVTGKTVTITSCPGAATCDTTIATSKGWTVVK